MQVDLCVITFEIFNWNLIGISIYSARNIKKNDQNMDAVYMNYHEK